jgi:3-polyprenyl-4-hydroxybenzoate decarboxylase
MMIEIITMNPAAGLSIAIELIKELARQRIDGQIVVTAAAGRG